MINTCQEPTFATAPGETLLETIDALGMNQVELALRTGLSKKTINLIIKGNEPITQETALALEKVLRVPAHFWLNLDSKAEVDELFAQWKAGQAKIVSEPEDKPWKLREFMAADLDGNLIRVFYDVRGDM